jgi:NAD(P)-dependent dehydrogenase (short-subunit alcohol dehydrogenase family)
LGYSGTPVGSASVDAPEETAMDLKLTNKRALVSGSTKGIGLAIATALAREGARVMVNGRMEASVAAALAEIRGSVPNAAVEGFAGDLATSQAADLLGKKFPAVDILVNNLGIFEPKPFEEIPDDDWRRFFEVNVLSGVRLSRMYLSGMKERGWGRIVFISSESAINSPAGMIHYGMTKTAQLAVSRGLAESCAGTGVTVNAVLPGPTHSPGVDEFVNQISGGKPFAEFEKEFFKSVRPSSLLKRFITIEEVASLVAYVCSPLASATTGAALRVDGGVVQSCF